ncbi:hypothetical protein QW71_27955 [Paenibacillus sp. IHB B 3415]|uniref:glycosyltransferase n=1 Tax=Paenibacillus sp. IHB B 3415 TaxID=867080 RepID=UPI000574A63B|nr:glycosyltransferase [Paenibacillus sp. IHB B 3415]KHL92663.1 hypothetical protein QW71_27955 [Paenibacillus sp. IHB B 3415]
MRVLIDIQTLFTDEKKRGIGIYTYNWIKSLIKLSNTDRFYLMRKVSDKWYFTFISNSLNFDERINEMRFWHPQELEDFIEQKEIDIIHFTSPYMFDIEVPRVTNPRVKKSYLVYDLIPLVMKQEYYLKWPKNIQSLYDERSERIKESDIILTISEASKQDLVKFLNIDSDKIKVIFASTNEELFNPKSYVKQLNLLKELNINSSFVYSLTGYDPRKNNKGLISAFSQVAKVNENIILVIGGIKRSEEQKELVEYAESRGLSKERLVLLGYVSEEALVELYQGCEVFVFPSLYEGFGLPVLEAMRCGTAVITSNRSSLPEIAGDATLLVDPLNEQDLERELKKIIFDSTLRNELTEKGLRQATNFSWSNVVTKSMEHFRDVFFWNNNVLHHINNDKPRLAYFSPLNPQVSGISDYSEELLLYLKDYYDVTIFVKGYKPSNTIINGLFEVIDIDRDKVDLESFEKRIYHIGNNEYHEWIIKTLEKYPGFIVLHDFNLFGYYVYSTYLKGDKDKFIQEMIYNSGEQAQGAIKSMIESNIIPESQQFPLSNKVVDLSSGVIVHSNWVKKSLLINNDFKGPIEVIPLGTIFENSEEKVSTREKRKYNSEFKIGVFGNVIPNKRIDVIIKTLYRLVETNPEVQLNIIGYVEDNYKKELNSLIERLNLKKKISFINAPNIEDFKRYIKESDLCVNLRWPTMGETSATLVRALSYGVPCIVSCTGSYTEFPDNCVWKVDVDQYEEELLLAYLLEVCNNPTVLAEMSNNAIEYIKNHCDFNIISAKYQSLIK